MVSPLRDELSDVEDVEDEEDEEYVGDVADVEDMKDVEDVVDVTNVTTMWHVDAMAAPRCDVRRRARGSCLSDDRLSLKVGP